MIDIHSHVIFGVDDGPASLEESLDLIGEAYAQGVRVIIATSHRRKGMFETPEETIKKNFSQVKEKAEKIYPGLVIGFGGELYYTKELISKLEKKQLPRLNYTRYILLEFSKNTPWKIIKEAVNEVNFLGLTPVLAHIERYDALEFNKTRIQDLINRGAYTQVNSSHVLKPRLFGDAAKLFKKRAQYFLEEDLVHCVASDMHNLHSRPPFMAEAYTLISQKYGEHKAECLFKNNPQTLLENNDII